MASAPSDSWFWLDGKRPIGPLSAEQWRAAVSAGAVRPETMVRNTAWPHWCQAAQSPGLFPSRLAVPPDRPAPSPPPEPRPTAESSTPPPPPEPKPALGFIIEVAEADGPEKASKAKRKKKGPPTSIFLGLLGVLAVCVALVVAVLKLNAPPETQTPAKRPVAQAPKKPEADAPPKTPEPQKTDETDRRWNEWDLTPVRYDPTTFEVLEPPA